MPIHDWTRIFAGAFHDLHQAWIIEMRNVLNGGLLPEGYYAAAEQVTGDRNPDVVTLESLTESDDSSTRWTAKGGGLLVEQAPPKVRFEFESELRQYTEKASRVAVRHVSENRIVAIIEVISPGNKHSRKEVDSLREKIYTLIDNGVQILLVDLIPPGRFDPEGLPRALSIDSDDVVPAVTSEEPLSLCSLRVNPGIHGYVELCGVGRVLPQMPLFLSVDRYINVPLEETYTSAWQGVPAPWKRIIEGN